MSMENIKHQGQAAELQREIEEAKSKLSNAESKLRRLHKECKHNWGEVKYDPIYREAYTIPGDPPGTMGVDWRGPCYVPSETTPRWTRACKNCGYVEETKRTKKEHRSFPGGISGEVNIPEFNDV